MLYPLILTFLAGLATLIGVIPIFIKIKNKDKIIASACAFASGVMICISIFDLIPESLRYLSSNFNPFWIISLCFIFIVIGIILSMILDHYIDRISNSGSLFKVGILSMIAIILHNVPEGIVTFIVSNKNIMLGISICIAIALHNIPEGISIAIPIYYSTKSKKKAILYTFLAGLSEPLGAILTGLFLVNYVNDIVLGLLFAFIAGVMIQISSGKLLPTGNGYDKKMTIIFFIVGFIVMLFSLQLENILG
ncbi:MAG: ZIP family metal transporter [Bacilli bacterium]|nr:ZIP family metal transporter [Bacilli bacterium]